MTRSNGVIAYEGPSQLDGEPIVLILTCIERPSNNIKTGQMVQAVVLRQSEAPTEAVKHGTDASICGDCPLRREVCHVNLIPFNAVWRKYREGGYPHLDESHLERIKARQLRLRITAYGDPSAVPIEVWENLLDWFPHHTGYTHQWRNLNERWSKFLMASCETPHDVVLAKSRGWSTFRVKNEGDPILSAEIVCPNTTNASIQCANCRLCSGSEARERHVVVDVHGLDWKKEGFQKLTTANN